MTSLSKSSIVCLLCQHQRMKHLEDKIRLLANAKDDIQQHYSQQLQTIAELQAKNSNAALELESLKRRLEELNQVLPLSPQPQPPVFSPVSLGAKRSLNSVTS